MYRPSTADGRVYQGEILQNVIQIKPSIESIQNNEEGVLEVFPMPHELVIVMSQDCDLEQDYKRRQAGEENQNERFHYLQKVEPGLDLQGQGLTAIALDFKIYFTIPTDELYARLPLGIRRKCILTSPYVEHLAHRFFKFQSRVALPRDHEIDPIPEAGDR